MGARGEADNRRTLIRAGRYMGSIPDGIIWIFHRPNLSVPNLALGVTKPLTEMRARITSSGLKAASVYG